LGIKGLVVVVVFLSEHDSETHAKEKLVKLNAVILES
jgi:hypothetical protein